MASFMANGPTSRLGGRARRPRPRAAGAIRTLADDDGGRPRARHLGHRDDRPPRRARRRRRGALFLPAGRLPGSSAGREVPAPARRHRPGDTGRRAGSSWRSRDQRPEGRLRRDRGALPRRMDLQLHQPRQPRRRGDHAQLARRGRLALRGPYLLPQPDRATRPGSTRRSSHVTMVGLNHGCWGVEQDYDGADPMPLLADAWERRRNDPTLDPGAAASAPARDRDGLDPRRLLPVLLLHRRGARGVPREADDARRGHPLAGRATTGATTRSRR